MKPGESAILAAIFIACAIVALIAADMIGEWVSCIDLGYCS